MSSFFQDTVWGKEFGDLVGEQVRYGRKVDASKEERRRCHILPSPGLPSKSSQDAPPHKAPLIPKNKEAYCSFLAGMMSCLVPRSSSHKVENLPLSLNYVTGAQSIGNLPYPFAAARVPDIVWSRITTRPLAKGTTRRYKICSCRGTPLPPTSLNKADD